MLVRERATEARIALLGSVRSIEANRDGTALVADAVVAAGPQTRGRRRCGSARRSARQQWTGSAAAPLACCYDPHYMDTVTLTIDGRSITVEKGKTVLQAAIENGIQIPYYCYHPALGVDGSCRVCIVKIEKMPKLQTSCSTVCTDGMVVDTQIARGRRGARARVRVPAHQPPARLPGVRQGRRVPAAGLLLHVRARRAAAWTSRAACSTARACRADVDFGPTLMLNRNRCILCTRCVRFMRDIDGDAQIGVQDRGYGSEIATFQEEGVHSLLSGNLMDVCPVGAHHDARLPVQVAAVGQPDRGRHHLHAVLEGLQHHGLAEGEARVGQGRRSWRASRRGFNPDVNGYWMCDIGRFDYHWVEGDDRLRKPLRPGRGGRCSSRSAGTTCS